MIFEFSSIVFMLLDVIDGTSFKSNFDAIVPVYPISILSFISSDDVVLSLFVFCTVSVFLLDYQEYTAGQDT